MKSPTALHLLTLLTLLLAAAIAGVGLFSQGGDGPFTFTSVHGDTVEIYGRGIYRNDAAFKAPILRGTDAVILFIGVPLLVLAIVLDRRGGLRPRLFLTSVLSLFLYYSTSLALNAIYNNLALAYILCVSASLFAFVIGFRSIDLSELAARTLPRMPHRWIAVFLFFAGLSLVIWLVDILVSLSQGTVPANVDHYTTEVTYVLDLAVLMPSIYLAGVLAWRRRPLGTLLASVLITLNVLIGLVVAGQSVMQALDGIILTPGEYAAYVAPFVILSLIAAGLLVRIYRHIS